MIEKTAVAKIRRYLSVMRYPETLAEIAHTGQCSNRYAFACIKSECRCNQQFAKVRFRWTGKRAWVVFPPDWSEEHCRLWITARGHSYSEIYAPASRP
jgi:hypothetical protein